jgi:hypothetical protein
MAARATEPVVQIKVAEGGVEVIAPHQADHATAKPDAFRIAGGTIDCLRGFDEFVGLALAVLGGIARRARRRSGGIGRRGFRGLILGAQVAALGDRASDPDQQGHSSRDNVTRYDIPAFDQQSTHEVPDFFWPDRSDFAV